MQQQNPKKSDNITEKPKYKNNWENATTKPKTQQIIQHNRNTKMQKQQNWKDNNSENTTIKPKTHKGKHATANPETPQ